MLQKTLSKSKEKTIHSMRKYLQIWEGEEEEYCKGGT
jgi:hypothetical protein